MIGGTIPRVRNLRLAVELSLYSNNITGPIPQHDRITHRLEILKLQENSLTGKILVELTSMKKLEVLLLYATTISRGRRQRMSPITNSFLISPGASPTSRSRLRATMGDKNVIKM
jgi:hypothetical protein